MAAPNGTVLWEGPSEVDGKPVAVILTGLGKPSDNRKTGTMLQTWILRADIDPISAVNTGEDKSICDSCQHRRRLHEDGKYHRTCYVTLMHGPQSVYRSYRRGNYPHLRDISDKLLESMRKPHWDAMRLGSYGEPTIAPMTMWTYTFDRFNPRIRTGYTHRWRSCDQRFRKLCMASADSSQDVRDANAMGWRTFLVLPGEAMPSPGAIHCPSDPTRSDAHVPCESCGQCAGADGRHKRNVWIRPHGMTKHFVTLPTIGN